MVEDGGEERAGVGKHLKKPKSGGRVSGFQEIGALGSKVWTSAKGWSLKPLWDANGFKQTRRRQNDKGRSGEV